MGIFSSPKKQHAQYKARQKAFRSGGTMSARDAQRAAAESGKSPFQQAKAARAAASKKRGGRS